MVNQMIELMVNMMLIGMTMGMARPVMAQVAHPRPIKPNGKTIAEQRIKMMRADFTRYEELPVVEADHEACRLRGYPKGARCKFCTRGTGVISTFCHLEWKLE